MRSLLKRKGYTLINITGLALGMSVCLLILLFVQHELSYDDFHTNGDNVYRVVLDRKYPGRSTTYAIIPLSIGKAIQNENPEVLQSTRLFHLTQDENFYVKIGIRFLKKKMCWAQILIFSGYLRGNFYRGIFIAPCKNPIRQSSQRRWQKNFSAPQKMRWENHLNLILNAIF